jgi:hypothetical protein
MDDRPGKHSAKGLRTDAQQMTANIHVGRVEKLLLSGVFLLLLCATEEKGRLIYNLFFLVLHRGQI